MPAGESGHGLVRRLACVMVLLLSAAGPQASARDGYKEIYKDAMTAVARKNWSDAARLMQQAVNQNPEAGGDRIRLTGMHGVEYLPYYHLGLAHYELGRYEEASAAWEESERQGEVRNDREKYRDVQAKLEGVRVVLAAKNARAALAQADRALQQLDQFDEAPCLDPARREDAFVQGRAECVEQMEGARNGLARGRPPWAEIQAAAELLAQASICFDGLREGLVQRSQELCGQEVRRAAEEPLPRVSPGPQVAPSHPDPEGQETAGRGAQLQGHGPDAPGRLERAVEPSAGRSPSSAPPPIEPRVAPLAAPVEAPVGSPAASPTGAGPPPRLARAAGFYFNTEYEAALRVLDALEPAVFPDQRARIQLHLLRAAARYAVYLTGGNMDEGLLEAARAEVQALLVLDPEFEPDTRYFSPRIRALFHEKGP